MHLIGVIDLDISNVGSVINMINNVGGRAVEVKNKDSINSCSSLILPGVGSFDAGMARMDELGLRDTILDNVSRGKNILGICLGMQMLFEDSEEGTLKGLGLLKGHVKKFKSAVPGFRIPHMGWNEVIVRNRNSYFTDEMERFYFVHSYYVEAGNQEDIFLETNYGGPFTSAVAHQNIIGVQFHPEKSHRFGKAFFKRYVECLK